MRQRHAGALHLTGTALAPELAHQLDYLPQGGRTERFALGEEPATRVDRQTPPQRGGSRVEQRGGAARGLNRSFVSRQLRRFSGNGADGRQH